jgi:hypothetical protein
MGYQRIGVAITATIVALLVGGTANADSCSNETVNGSYGAQATGSNAGTPIAEVGIVTADGKGNVTGQDVVNLGGTSTSRTTSGTYDVNSDCTITAELTFTGTTANSEITANFFGVIVLGGTEVYLNQTDPNTVVTGFIKKIRPHQ